MNTLSTSAESARENARQSDGRFGSHPSGESAASLDPAASGQGASAPQLSAEESEHLENEISERATFHDDEEDSTYEEISHYQGCRNEDGAFESEADLANYRVVADEHNMHVAARIAYEAPPQATVAEIYTDTDQVGAYYGRDGTVIEHLPDGGNAEFHADADNGIATVPKDLQYTGPGFSTVKDSAFIDLEAAREQSDAYLLEREGDGVPQPRAAETAGLQRKASLRPVGETDTVSDGDFVHSPARRFQPETSGYATGTAFDPTINGVQVFNENGSGITSIEDPVIYTDQQQTLQPSERSAGH